MTADLVQRFRMALGKQVINHWSKGLGQHKKFLMLLKYDRPKIWETHLDLDLRLRAHDLLPFKARPEPHRPWLFIHLLQQALVILLIGRTLGVKEVGRAVFLQSSLQVALPLQRDAEVVVRVGIIGG